MDNHHLHQLNWAKVLAVLNQELPETTTLDAEEFALLAELKEIRNSSKMYSDFEFDAESKINAIQQRLNFKEQRQPGTTRLWLRIAGIAAAVSFIVYGIYFFNAARHPELVSESQYTNDIVPGKNAATLTLANGKKIFLSDTSKGVLVKEPGLVVTKTADGQLIYTVKDPGLQRDHSESVLGYNTLSTAEGQQYQVRLPDGSDIYLNAVSTLKYPVSFTSFKERKVELHGEAYFEVAKDKSHPFVVKTEKQEVKVLGTHFNINSYTDEPEVKTTLLEGSVSVSVFANAGGSPASGILKPGEQSVFNGKDLNIREVDAEDAVAWKNGLFMFNDEPLSEVMRKISRWYNVKINFEDAELARLSAFGTISKYNTVSKVLAMMEKTGDMHFEINGKTISVMKSEK